jgi:hypothetical protein
MAWIVGVREILAIREAERFFVALERLVICV